MHVMLWTLVMMRACVQLQTLALVPVLMVLAVPHHRLLFL